MIGCLRTCVLKQPIIALSFESENELKFYNLKACSLQGGQSRGPHDWVHGFPESVKSFITFAILSQISCGKVQKKTSHIFLHKTVSKLLLDLL